MTTGAELVADFGNLLNGVPYRLGAEWTNLSRRPAALDCSEAIEGMSKRHGVHMVDGSGNQENYCRAKGTYRGGAAGIEWARKIPGALLFRRAGTGGLSVGHVVMVRGYNSTWESRSRAYGTGSWQISGRPFTGGALIPGVNYLAAPPPTTPPPPPPKVLPARPTLIYGQSGQCVSHAQFLLRWITGFQIPVSGVFDAFLLDTVVKFQRWYHIPETGQLDTKTWQVIDLVTIQKGQTPKPC